MVEFLLFTLAVLLLLAAAWVVFRSGRPEFSESLVQKLGERKGGANPVELPSAPGAARWKIDDYLRAWLRKAGIENVVGFWVKFGLADLLVSVLLGLFTTFWVGLLVFVVLVPAAVWLYLISRANKRRAQVVLDLPNFLDGMVRITRVGASLPAALLAVTKESRGPVQALFYQVALRQQAGLSLEQSLKMVGDFYGIKELTLISAVLRLNQRYGGRSDLVLERVADWMRTRVAAQAEFAALSAETRLSALMLSVLIPGIAAFILVYNFQYLASMWADPLGRNILIAGVVLMVSGIVILMRMSKIRD